MWFLRYLVSHNQTQIGVQETRTSNKFTTLLQTTSISDSFWASFPTSFRCSDFGLTNATKAQWYNTTITLTNPSNPPECWRGRVTLSYEHPGPAILFDILVPLPGTNSGWFFSDVRISSLLKIFLNPEMRWWAFASQGISVRLSDNFFLGVDLQVTKQVISATTLNLNKIYWG